MKTALVNTHCKKTMMMTTKVFQSIKPPYKRTRGNRRKNDKWRGTVFIYSCFAQSIFFEIHCVYSL